MTVKYVICLLYLLKTNCYIVLVLGVLPIAQQEKLIEWHLWLVARTRTWVIQVNFNQGKQNLVQVSGEFELSKYKFFE